MAVSGSQTSSMIAELSNTVFSKTESISCQFPKAWAQKLARAVTNLLTFKRKGRRPPPLNGRNIRMYGHLWPTHKLLTKVMQSRNQKYGDLNQTEFISLVYNTAKGSITRLVACFCQTLHMASIFASKTGVLAVIPSQTVGRGNWKWRANSFLIQRDQKVVHILSVCITLAKY